MEQTQTYAVIFLGKLYQEVYNFYNKKFMKLILNKKIYNTLFSLVSKNQLIKLYHQITQLFK